MNTILYIKEILHHYQNSVRGIVSEEARSIVDAEFLANIKKVANKFPVELISLCDKYINTTDAIDYVENIEQYASQNYVPLLTNHTKFTDVIEGKIIETPGFKDSYDVNEDLNSFLLKAILSLPIGKIRITFIDLDNNLGCDWFEKNINAKIYNEGVIINVSTLEKYLEHMSNQIEQIRHQYYNYPEFCKKNKNIPEPYELIVIRPDANSQALDIINSDKFSTIRLHGESAGVYVVKITEKQSDVKDKVVPRKLSVDELSYEDVKTNIKQKRKQCTFSTFSLYEFQCSKNNLDDLKQPLYEHINCAKEIISLNTFCKKLSRPTPSTFLTVKYQSEVEEYINKAKADSMKELGECVEEIMKEEIEEQVYNAYKPEYYRRTNELFNSPGITKILDDKVEISWRDNGNWYSVIKRARGEQPDHMYVIHAHEMGTVWGRENEPTTLVETSTERAEKEVPEELIRILRSKGIKATRK